MRSRLDIWALAIVVGAVDALMLKAFEFLVNDGTQWLWNDVFHSDTHRWLVLPLAAVLGVLFATILSLLKQPRIPEPKVDLLAPEPPQPPATLQRIVTNLSVGLGGLLAGASLGPEAPLMSFSQDAGEWSARHIGEPTPTAKTMSLASIGALLVAFFGSIIPVLIPLLQIWAPKRRARSVNTTLFMSIPIVLAALSAFGVLWLFNHNVVGWGTIPTVPHYHALDWILALVVGLIGAGFGWALRRAIVMLHDKVTSRAVSKLPSIVSALAFGLALGVLYLLGGPTSEFNGSRGSHDILQQVPQYGFWVLVIILIAKLLATAWSMAAGYRGGLIFPSIYCGVVIFLIVHALFGTASNGVMIGSIVGILGAMLGPLIAGIFVIALIPYTLLPIALVAIVGSALGNQLIERLTVLRKARTNTETPR